MFTAIWKTSAILLTRLQALTVGFLANPRGNVAVITALSAIPIISTIGCVVDYSMATMIKTKLQAAADAATLAAVSANSPIVATAKSMTGNGTITGGQTYTQNFFDSNLSSAPANTGYTSPTRTASVSKNGSTITATVSFSAQVPTFFLGIIGYPNISVTGQSTSSYTLPNYIDFYLMLDVSGSMGMPSTTAEQARLQAVNPDNFGQYPTGCTFACHFTAQGACGQSSQGPIPAVGQPTNPSPGGYCQGFIISRLGTSPVSFANNTTNTTNGSKVNWTNPQVSSCASAGTTSCIQLRLDAVGYAVNALLTTANSTEGNDGITNQFRVGLYPFIQNLCYSGVNGSNSCSVGLTTSLTGSTINNFATQLASLLDTGQNSTLGSGGTHFENALNTMNKNVISNPAGTGTSASPLPYLFIVTDGSQDYQTQSGGNWGSQNWSATSAVPYQNSATVVPPNTVTSTDYCTTMKKRGITIAILYIPYQTIQNANASFASNEDGYANNNIPNIAPALQTCASTNFFYTANTPTDIQNALIAMFQQAVSTAHVSN
ncbi:MAG: pilus assembly protein TadG-related protein [Xanthobacteraceae bacterium]